MEKTFRPYHPEQVYLLPPSLDEWLPEGHLARFIAETVDHLDLSPFLEKYRGPKGYPPYDPRMMVKVLLYAYATGVRSSRKIEQKLWEDVAFRYLAGNQQPSYRTIAEFRHRHLEEFEQLFVQVLLIAQAAGLVKLGRVALDGTKVQANASIHSAMSYGHLRKRAAELRRQVAEMVEEAERVDAEEDERFGPQRRGEELPEELRDARRRLRRIEEAIDELERRAREEAERKRPPAPPAGGGEAESQPSPRPDDRQQYNFTDPESRVMRGGNNPKGFLQAYNVQAVVDTDSGIVVAVEATNQAADSPHLPGMVEAIERNVSRSPKELLADAGYYSEANLDVLEQAGISALIPPEKVTHSQWRHGGPSPRGRIPKGMSRRDRMRRRLETQAGRAAYKLRQETIEPVFGQVKEQQGFRRFLLRGLRGARAETFLVFLTYNLRKLFFTCREKRQKLWPAGAVA